MKNYVFVTLFSFLVLIFFFNRGFAYYDEGFIVHAAQRVLQGQIPYRDFDLIYTPGTVFLTAAVFKLFGESILTGRVLSLLVSLLAGYLIYLICYRATKNSLSSFFVVLIYLAWGPTHINFPWPSMFALTTGLITLLLIPNYLLVGALTFITFFMKQNFGIAVFFSLIISIGLNVKLRKLETLVKFFLGILIGTAVFLAYLLLTGSFQDFLSNIYFYTIKRIFLEGVASTSFPTGLKGIFYLIPASVSLGAFFLVRKKPNLLILPIFTLFFYIFGIRPTTDYPHLVVLMAMAGIPLAVSYVGNRYVNSLQIIIGIIIVFVGFYTALFKNYYRWDSPLVKQKYFIAEPKARIFVDLKFKKVIPEVVSEIKKNTEKNDYIFIFPNAPIFYFLTGRRNPTRYINLPQYLHTTEQEREVINNLKMKRVRLILTNEPPENSNYHIVSEYILKNYLKKKEFFEFTLWERVESEKYSEVLNI